MNIYAFIFARGGSVGLPGKNIMHLGEVPLLGHSIQLAKKIKSIKKIFVSTDSDAIAEVAREYGAYVIKRPEFLSLDRSPEWLAWQHAINYLNQNGDYFDIFLSLPTTSPLRSAADVESCLQALGKDIDVVISVTPSSRNPYFNMVTRKSDGTTKLVLGDASVKRRQDAPEIYDITAVAYVTRPKFIILNDGLFSGRLHSVIIPRERSVDIDDKLDFLLADAIFKQGLHQGDL